MTFKPDRPLRQRTAGVLGGMSNQAIGEYCRLLNERLNARLGGWDNGERLFVGFRGGDPGGAVGGYLT